MNSKQKFENKTVQVYKVKKNFWKTPLQNGSFQAISERAFFHVTKKLRNKILKTSKFWTFSREITFKKCAYEMGSFRCQPSER